MECAGEDRVFLFWWTRLMPGSAEKNIDFGADLGTALKKKVFFLFGFSLVIHVLTAYFSVGFFSWDEHYQTLEFLSPRLGRGSVADLPWEYHSAVRPWIQPAFYYSVIEGLRLIGIENASVWAFFCRLVSAVLSWSALLGLTLCSFKWFQNPKSRLMALYLATTLCFLPFIDVRTSSENMSAALFFLGISAFFLLSWKKALVAGLLMGLAVQFRYQTVFMVLGFLGFLFFQKREKRSCAPETAAIVAMVAMTSAFGVWVDSWGYGSLTFVPWNYFHVNLIEGKADWFSRDPVWFYLTHYLELMPPVGALALFAVILGWIRRPTHVLTWVTLPSFLIHCLITHKEVRFLFPLIPATPFLIVMGLESFSETGVQNLWKWARWILLPANGVLLLVFVLKPAYSPFQLYGYVGSHPEIREIVYRDENPFVQIRALETRFYRPPELAVTHIGSYLEMSEKLSHSKSFWLFEGSSTLPPAAGALQGWCELKYSAFPQWLNRLDFIPGIRFANRRSLFFCAAP
jgi:phosphatidylinositol glycan class B